MIDKPGTSRTKISSAWKLSFALNWLHPLNTLCDGELDILRRNVINADLCIHTLKRHNLLYVLKSNKHALSRPMFYACWLSWSASDRLLVAEQRSLTHWLVLCTSSPDSPLYQTKQNNGYIEEILYKIVYIYIYSRTNKHHNYDNTTILATSLDEKLLCRVVWSAPLLGAFKNSVVNRYTTLHPTPCLLCQLTLIFTIPPVLLLKRLNLLISSCMHIILNHAMCCMSILFAVSCTSKMSFQHVSNLKFASLSFYPWL